MTCRARFAWRSPARLSLGRTVLCGRPSLGHRGCEFVGGLDPPGGDVVVGGSQVAQQFVVGQDRDGFFEAFQVLRSEQDRGRLTVDCDGHPFGLGAHPVDDLWSVRCGVGQRHLAMVLSMTRLPRAVHA